MNTTIQQFGFWSGVIAFAATISFVIVQLLQILGLFSFPFDEIAIYTTSMCIVLPFILEMLALHYITPPEKKFWSHAALIFTTIYAVFVTANYVVQLATVIPMKLKGDATAINILDQTPHSMFWNFDALGYIFMGLATLIAIPALEKRGVQKWVRISFIANAIVTPLISFVYFYPEFSDSILLFGLPWAITAPLFMLLLALMFRNELHNRKIRNDVN